MLQGIFIQSTVIVQLFGATCKGVLFKFWIIQYTINVQVMELRVGTIQYTINVQVLELRVGTVILQ